MIAYNTQWLSNLLVREQADTALNKHCISKAEQEQVYAAYPAGFYTPNIFVRIGLFILTWVILIFGISLLSLGFFSAADSEKAVGGLFIFFGLLIYGGLEMMVKNNHYHSGVDDGLIWMCGICIVGGLNVIAEFKLPAQVNAILIFIIALFLFIRFINMLMAGVAALALLGVIFFSIIRFGEVAKAIAPFVMMLSSAGIYFYAQQQLNKKRWPFHTNGLLLVTVVALVCLYTAGNYFVVREASISMFNLDLKEGESIPFGWLFWIFTVGIPILYIVRGIQKKDAVLLRVGLLLVAAIVFTVRYYYHVMPAEIAMVLGGIIFIVLAYALTRYLHEPKHGFTYKDLDDAFFMDKLHVESLVIAQSFSGPKQTTDSRTQFGGGTGGGGGASGEY
ncbi:MAG: hypothetical protein QM726_25945 [Chitinophagaceae bacterium]